MSKTARFDDRVDTDPELSSGETLALLMRSLKFIGRVRVLFFYKVLFASVAILPPLILPWILKIIVDQVILQQPFQLEEVPFPPFMMPFIHLIMDMSPTGIMLSTTLLSFALLFIFGLRAWDSSQIYLRDMMRRPSQSRRSLQGPARPADYGAPSKSC